MMPCAAQRCSDTVGNRITLPEHVVTTCPKSRISLGLVALAVAAAVHAGGPTGGFRNGFEPLVANTVQDIQQGVATGAVYLPGRVVTAVSADRKNLWIADSAAAALQQGVFVIRGSSAAVLPPEIVVGTHITVFGSAAEFDVGFPPQGDTLTQIENHALGVASLSTFTPAPLQLSTVSQLASIVDGEPYEGVLVRVANLRVLSTASGNRITVGDNIGSTIVLDDDAGSIGLPPVGTCYGSVTGVMHLSVVENERRMLPRGLADAVAGNSCN